MISLRHVDRVYPLKGGPYYALRNINLEVKEGDFLTIMGPSGSGKSTLLHILGLHDAAWDGEYFLLGQPVHTLEKKKRFALQKAHLGFVFQSYHLLDDLTVYENLEIPLSYRDTPKKDRESIVCDALDRFHIVGKKDLYPSQLSGGQQQLVGIARALVAPPSLLLADEPTGNLHSDQGREIMELFRKLNQQDGVTIIQVTHSNDNAAYGSRIIRLADGMMLK
jgi:putative ABC transport system ATP-binding protein